MYFSMKHYYSLILLFALQTSCLTEVYAQVPPAIDAMADTSRYRIYRDTPVWKDMLDDTTANYFEVQKAFALFWEGKELPEEEDDVIGENGRLQNNFINRVFRGEELRSQQLRDAYAFDYKRYQHWLLRMEPYVQEDGRILYPYERLQLWRQHYEELDNQ